MGNSCGHISLALSCYKGPESTVGRGPESEEAILEQGNLKVMILSVSSSRMLWLKVDYSDSQLLMDSLLSCL